MARRLWNIAKSWMTAALLVSAIGPVLSGCCVHHRGGCAGRMCSSCETSGTPDQPVPAAPEYPRFHPVPTRPVFLPDGIEPAPQESQLRPTAAPALSAAPDDGWHAPRKADAIAPAL